MAMPAIHPGEHLGDELEELGMSAAALARQIEGFCCVSVFCSESVPRSEYHLSTLPVLQVLDDHVEKVNSCFRLGRVYVNTGRCPDEVPDAGVFHVAALHQPTNHLFFLRFGQRDTP